MKDFERDLRRLEGICDVMREGGSGLAQSMKLFEEGIQLVRSLEKMLHQAERRIEILVNEPQGENEKPKLELFAEDPQKPETPVQESQEPEPPEPKGN